MEITRGRLLKPKKVCVYGPEGIGKSTFASCFPDPLFIDTEGSTKELDVARFPAPSSWQMLKDEVQHVISYPDCCRTLVIDTADWAEQMEIKDLVDSTPNVDGLEGFNYGKGYTYSAERFGKLLNMLNDVIEKGVHVVMTAHAQLRKIELPEEMGAYDHWEMKTSKKVAPMIREWADMVLFANYKVNVVNVDNQGAQKGKNKAQGGRRVMYTTHTPFWDAKNRYGLPEELPFDFSEIAHIFKPADADPSKPAKKEKPPKPAKGNTDTPMPDEVPSPKSAGKPEKEKEAPNAFTDGGGADFLNVPEPPEYMEPDMRVPKELRDLMVKDRVSEWDIQNIVQAKGFFPSDMNIWDYPREPDDFIAWLVSVWPQMLDAIKTMHETEEIPFG